MTSTRARLRARVLTACLALMSVLTGPRTSLAVWPHDPNVNVPLCTAGGNQQFTAIVGDGAGGAIVAWTDFRGGATSDIYAQHVLASGAVDPTWPAGGRALCAAANHQEYPRIVGDGAGGAFVTWQDLRNGTYDIYAQHVLASGAVDGAWPVDGRALCTAANHQHAPTIVGDGAGGAFVTWYDRRSGTDDIYAQHVLASGAVDGAWPVDGLAVCTAASHQSNPEIVGDGAGGAIVTWYDTRSLSSSDIYAQHVLASGSVDGGWPVDGQVLCTAANSQVYPTIVGDGAGGAIVTWEDRRNAGIADVYAQHVLASGTVDGGWPANGRALCTAANHQFAPRIVGDGAGGAFVTWQDRRTGTDDIYAQRVLATGGVADGWPADGKALCTAGNGQFVPTIAGDGAGGAIVAWQDRRSGTDDVYAQHVLASGVVDGAWPTDGRALCTAADFQRTPAIVGDGMGGAIVTWQDGRSGNDDVYAQRIGAFGYLGPEPELLSVRDVPNDNGGKVKVSWSASWLDTELPYVVDHYWIFRSAPPQAALQALGRGARTLRAGAAAPEPGERAYLTTVANATTHYWEYLASQAATHFASGYSYTASTTNDSMAAGNPRTAFIVVAYDATGALYFVSNPDSGYSVDNLPPAIPGPLVASAVEGATLLSWSPSTEPDFDGFHLHRGAAADFVPSLENRIAATAETEFLDAGPAGSHYKLSAVDTHGNESAFASLSPSEVVGVPRGRSPEALAFGRPSPNPASTPVTVRLALPREEPVSLSIHDVAGRQLRSLLGGAVAAGERDVTWDLRDAAGARVPDGVYWMRLVVGGRTFSRRIAVVR